MKSNGFVYGVEFETRGQIRQPLSVAWQSGREKKGRKEEGETQLWTLFENTSAKQAFLQYLHLSEALQLQHCEDDTLRRAHGIPVMIYRVRHRAARRGYGG